ncbi:translocation/assembly module TamB domain-containing protein [Alteromonas sp. ASW11-19]|uniref:Translocation/assembly module TamB domain-containing protein n=1 Tax=Alteromonas salexigens TaxID=2982530 RepID=A0ABT2VJZ2_9ALTE|nr:translocation/assembly module TamB domain-containing protein [Alteromonas salexigens]MCU7553566.1 translocation/assembly module TamB domain-containing protein [Alteromonas salexigens]
MRKRTISLWALSPFLLIALLIALLLSPLGTPVIRSVAVSVVPDLTIVDLDGSLAGDLTVDELHWQNEQWQVEVGSATVNLSWRCLLAPRVCVESLAASKVYVTQLAPAPPSAPETETTPLTLPIEIRVDRARVRDLRVVMEAQTIALRSAKLQLSAYRQITITEPAFAGLTVTLPVGEQPVQQPPQSYSLSYTAPQLPEIKLPIPVTITDFSLTDTRIVQGDSTQSVPAVRFASLQFAETRLALDELTVQHESASVAASAEVDFSGNYPLDVALQGEVALDSNTTQQLTLTAEGSLTDLNVALDASQAYDITANIQANILSDQLPLSVTAQWDEQPLPAQPQGTLHEGTISLQGTMGDYQLTGDSAATLPDIGRVPVTVDVVLNKHNIRVNTLQAKLLGGTVANTGTLYLNESVSWEGRTQLTSLSAAELVPQGPTAINGQFTSLMQLGENGPEMSISDLSVDAKLQGQPLNVGGSVVYAGGSDIIVATLTVTQDENRIQVAGQVFNKRYLDASVGLNLPSLNTLYPGVAGQINGQVNVTGNWQNPAAEGQINLAEVQVSPSINPSVAAQGALNGSIDIDGVLSEHALALDLTLPDHSLKLTLDGSWQNNRWQADVTDSQLGLLNTRWALDKPFNVAVQPTPLNVSVSSHCWQSRAEGSLCIKDVLYKDNKASWSVDADALPLGIWASELAGDLVPEAPEATLSVTTQGEVGVNTPMKARFEAAVTPAKWTLGKERPIVITLNSITASGVFENDELQASAEFVSTELGAVSASLTTSPLADSPPLAGSIRFKGLNVKPLKPLSPAIRELSGQLDGDIALDGTLFAPALTGTLTLNDGALDVQDMPVSLSNWQQTVTLEGKRASFDGSFMLGEGDGSLSGNVNWQNDLEFTANLKGTEFEVRQRDIRMKVSPDLTASVSKEKIDVSGSVNIPWARIVIEELPENAVSPSKDVHLRGEPPSDDPLDVVHASVMVNIDKAKTGEVKLEAFGLTANLHGGIRVNTQPSLVGYGDLQILDGRYQAYGQNLVIQTGEVQFNGPIEQPLLLVEAIRDPAKTQDNVIAGIRIDGPADSPNVNLFSDPSMDQQNVLSYLLTGEGPDSERTDPNYNALLLGFGLSNTESLTGQVGDALGIEDFSLSASETGVSVSGQLTDRLSVKYNVEVAALQSDATNNTLRRRQKPPNLALRYRLLPKLFLEAIYTTIEDDSEQALDLYYQFYLGENTDEPEEEEQD